MTDNPISPEGDFAERRAAARERAGQLQRELAEKGDGLAWFEALYEAAEGDPAQIPWAELAPRSALAEWLARDDRPHRGRAVDVACGLGDNAEGLAAAGYDVTAFDLSETAVAWARTRFPDSTVAYRQASLFDLPAAWRGGFDLVHEAYTIQALTPDMRARAMPLIADLVAPGGTLLVICRGRAEDEEVAGPPWPLAPSELAVFGACGLEEIRFERLAANDADKPTPEFRVTYSRAG